MRVKTSAAWWSVSLFVIAACSGGEQGSSGSGGSAQSGSSGSSSESSGSGAQATDGGTATTGDGGSTQAQIELPPMPTGLHGPAKPWAQMTPEEKGHWMGEAVLPAMSNLLHEYDPNRFGSVTCRTCHGANAREVHFHMPNSLPALPAPGSDAWTQWMNREPRMFQFMMTRVEQAQAQLLGVEPYNMQTNRGFGCFNCHPHAP